jgi:NADH-quinone oxidoreductase subunit M
VFHGEPDEANASFPELKLKEAAVLLPFVGIIVFTGVYPKPMLERIEPAVDALIAHVESKAGFESPQPAIVVIDDDDGTVDDEEGDH